MAPAFCILSIASDSRENQNEAFKCKIYFTVQTFGFERHGWEVDGRDGIMGGRGDILYKMWEY